ncbi:TYW2 protein, partial [Crypturellus undulatus]|nr:TYW2 protein [Crypturellus undulatus]
LEAEQILDGRYRLQRMPGGSVALPVLAEKLTERHMRALQSGPRALPCSQAQIQDPVPSKAAAVRTPAQQLCRALRRLVVALGESWTPELERDVPRSWQRHGDLILLGEESLRAALWQRLGPTLWETVASALGARRVARGGRVLPDGMRSPRVVLLLGQDGWVQHVDNGVRYTFDVTKCMFSPGNITEKLRVASLPCAGEVLVDLYAGIGYFTLPYLVHAAAAFAHACEWNGHAVEALRRSLALNGVQDCCRIHHGDNRQLQLRDVADRVNLGLIPSSEEGWPVACRVLRKDTGGVLHIHHNVEALPTRRQPAASRDEPRLSQEASSDGQEDGEREHESLKDTEPHGKGIQAAKVRPEWQTWAEAAAQRVRALLEELHGRPWRTSILHIEDVKSYAPHVHHIVLDLECRPTLL